ncbi:MAG TPA: PQQ-binding-like beta-propeller repeat protein [Gaiellaceae bacterium]|nr:PQQ-binding-like beta-propeller repeat protein [Gaiellaceae bacterium]
MKRALLAAGALVALGAVALAVYGFVRYRQGQDVRGSSTEEFVTTEAAPQAPAEPGVFWPTYRFDPERHGVADYPPRPPFKVRWYFRARTLVEFPPVIGYGRLYFTNNYGRLYAVNTKTGKRAWKKDSGRCVASSPAVWEHLVIQTYLAAHPCNRGTQKGIQGLVVARFAGFGQFRWQTRIAPSESSPVVVDGVVYVGDWSGRVYALFARTGNVKWVFKTKGRIKSGVAVSGNRVYVGSYDHHLYALNRETGKLVWRASAQQRLGKRGQFYATPAAAYGRVYVGGTDGKVYSFGATTGKLRWSHSTGNYVYGSPAVWRRLVLVGSYSRWFYAFDAATGDVRWRFRANGPISGSATVVRGIVYFSTLKERTYGLDARTGRPVWQFPDGKYAAVVADPERMYLTGYHRLYALDER